MIERAKLWAVLAGAAGGAPRSRRWRCISATHRISAGGDPVCDLDRAGDGLAEGRAGAAARLDRRPSDLDRVGLLAAKLLGPGVWVAAVAVGLAMIAMHLTGTFHPPAGIDPLVVVVNGMPWSFLLVPVAAGALLLARSPSPGTTSSRRVARTRGDTLAGAVVVTPIRRPGQWRLPAPDSAHRPRSSVSRRLVERRKRRAVADRDDRRARQPLLQQPVELGLRRLVERRRRLVEKQEIRLLQQRARDAEALLLAERQHPVPVRLLVEPLRQCGKADRVERRGDLLAAEGAGLRRIGDRAWPACRPGNTAAAAASSAARPWAP